MKYTCPLCGQEVPPSVYRKITGIWEERRKLLQKVKEQREKLKQKIAKGKEKLQRERTKFRKQKADLIKKAVDKRTKRFESQIKALKRREQRIEKRARDKIQKATTRAHSEALKRAKKKFKTFEKRFRVSVKNQMQREREQARTKIKSLRNEFRASVKEAKKAGAIAVKRKYERLERTFRTTLKSMETKNKQIQEQRRQIEELKKQLERRTTPQIEGLLYENKLASELKKHFREDDIRHTGKGGDVTQGVMRGGNLVGTMVYECKRVKHYSSAHVKQAAEAKKKRSADFAILVTSAMKRGTQGFYVERGVIIVHPAGVMSIAAILRNQIVQIAGMKLGQQQRDKAVKLILDYLEGPEFANSMDAIVQETIAVREELKDEMKKHFARWKKRHAAYKKIFEEASTVKGTSKTLLSGAPKKPPRKVAPPALVMIPKKKKSQKKKARS